MPSWASLVTLTLGCDERLPVLWKPSAYQRSVTLSRLALSLQFSPRAMLTLPAPAHVVADAPAVTWHSQPSPHDLSTSK